jgi:hypothetical protein
VQGFGKRRKPGRRVVLVVILLVAAINDSCVTGARSG